MENMGMGRIGKFLGGMEGLARFLEGMETQGRVVDVFLNASLTVAFVWGPIKFLLQVSHNNHLLQARAQYTPRMREERTSNKTGREKR